jgi:hypothetical protein
VTGQDPDENHLQTHDTSGIHRQPPEVFSMVAVTPKSTANRLYRYNPAADQL